MGEPGKIDLNTATVEQLASIPGVGESTARRIVAWRNESGGFYRASDVNAVPEVELSNQILARLTVRHPPEADYDHRTHRPHGQG